MWSRDRAYLARARAVHRIAILATLMGRVAAPEPSGTVRHLTPAVGDDRHPRATQPIVRCALLECGRATVSYLRDALLVQQPPGSELAAAAD
jgi:hypothetical protein